MEIINAIPEYVITAVVSTAIFYGMKYVEKLIHAKVLHAKTAQQREVWTLLEQVAMTTVNALVSADKPGHQKFDEASALVASYLSDHGIKVDMKTVQAAVQAAYEKSPLTPGQSIDPVKEAIKMAPNRADKLLVTDGSITQAKG